MSGLRLQVMTGLWYVVLVQVRKTTTANNRHSSYIAVRVWWEPSANQRDKLGAEEPTCMAMVRRKHHNVEGAEFERSTGKRGIFFIFNPGDV